MPNRVLLIENDFSDIHLIEAVAAGLEVNIQLEVVQDDEEAMAYLRQQGRYAGKPRPDLILLDMNNPEQLAHLVLAELKQDPGLRLIPVIVLSTSEAERDVLECYDLHSNCYIIKPANFDDFIEVLRAIDTFWFKIVVLPSEGRH